MYELRASIPDLNPLYEKVCKFVKEHQGEKGYIDVQPEVGDTIYTFAYNYDTELREECVVCGVRWNEETKDLEIVYEPYMRSYKVVYDDESFRGVCEDKDANAEWDSVKNSDVIYYVPTIINIAECIEEYVDYYEENGND